MLRSVASKLDNPPELVTSFINTDSVTWSEDALNIYFLPMDIVIARIFVLLINLSRIKMVY